MFYMKCKKTLIFLLFCSIICSVNLVIPFSPQAAVKTSDPDDPSLIFSDDFKGQSNESAETTVAGEPIPIKSDGIEDVYSFFGAVTNEKVISYGYPISLADGGWDAGLTLKSTAQAPGNAHIYNAVGLNKRYMNDKSTSYVTETKFASKGGTYPQKKVLIFPRFGLGSEWNHSYYFRIEMGTTNDVDRKAVLGLYEVRGQTSPNDVTAVESIELSELFANNNMLTAKTTLIDKPDGSVYVSLNLHSENTGNDIGFLEHTFPADSNPFTAADAPYGPGFGMANGNCYTNFRLFSVKDILSVKIKGQPVPGFKGSQYNYNCTTSGSLSAADITAVGNIPQTEQPEIDYNETTGVATVTYAGLTYTITVETEPGGVSIERVDLSVYGQPVTTPEKGLLTAVANVVNNTESPIEQAVAVMAVYNKDNRVVSCTIEDVVTLAQGSNDIQIEAQMPDIDYTDAKLKIFLWEDMENLVAFDMMEYQPPDIE